jgi:2,3-bisphosphoglycerate-independent phosphoglycerate mutase
VTSTVVLEVRVVSPEHVTVLGISRARVSDENAEILDRRAGRISKETRLALDVLLAQLDMEPEPDA